MENVFPTTPNITLFDPLAEFLGAGDGVFLYTFDDVVKLSGHACPTVAGAFLMTIQALQALYGDETPVRGGVRISVSGSVDQGVNGPISQVFTLLTGATAENGFHGLGGRFGRDHLMEFNPEVDEGFVFQRIDNNKAVKVTYDSSPIPHDPEMQGFMQLTMQGQGGDEAKSKFQEMWRGRVIKILEDAGNSTVVVSNGE